MDQKKFPFPFTPYSIQEDFMKNLYTALEECKIGIFESPTGTGKSLSIICGALTWLRDFEEKQKAELEALLQDAATTDSMKKEELLPPTTESLETAQCKRAPSQVPDWVLEFDTKKEQMEKATKLKEERENLLRREARMEDLRNKLRWSKKRKLDENENDKEDTMSSASKDGDDKEDDDEEDLVVKEYHSDDETKDRLEDEEEKGDMDEPYATKIYYCSRTHSQLSQFVHEVQKSPFGQDIKLVTLGSRMNLCINPTVKKLKSITLINDKCLDMQKKKRDSKKKSDEDKARKRFKGQATGCPFYSQNALQDFSDRLSVETLDVEQLVETGKGLKACPYYGTRHAVPPSQLVVLPYNTLLHKSTREACRIKLEGNVVIIDEAHNLLETISNIHSVEITGAQLNKAFSQLNQYKERYRSRLKAKNLMYIKQLLQVLSSWIKILSSGPQQNRPEKSEGATKLFTINDFLFETNMDNINFFKLEKYCQRSLISQKLNGFVEKKLNISEIKVSSEHQSGESKPQGMTAFLRQIRMKQGEDQKRETQVIRTESSSEESTEFSSPLMHIEGFIQALTNANQDGRVVVYCKDLVSKSSLRFLLLNPAVHFMDVLSQARSVIVAGGTMQPVDEFKHQLFSSSSILPARILEFSCGHVISGDQLLPMALSSGPSGVKLEFTFQMRDNPKLLDELGRVLTNFCNIIPAGLVCFFPSYDYEAKVFSYWEKTGVLSKLEKKKQIFREPKKAIQVEQVLGQYANVIKRSRSPETGVNGAILFCVVGGKMSEGINFSDDLGRCVMMVGLPYANIQSPELKEKMDYLNATMPMIDGKAAGQVYYENLCMKAVNQSIGRAIRHKNDYATILLLDHRYNRPNIQNKLPGWIKQKLQSAPLFGKAFGAIKKFFVAKM